ncbi:MAG TPA: FAD-dependent monooxygenase [Burkholderiales bacterium]|nr:FAD-dependent monooxygenase [Burkholderiales bacterium]
MDTDVLIVGAGPTGLMLANQLVRRGVRAIIVDWHSGPAQQSRAVAVQARTLEIYSKLGIVERALELGKRGTGANMWAEGRWMARIPLGEIGASVSPFPYVLILGQDDNERIMGEHLRKLGADVQWNTELLSFEQSPSHVTATLKQPDGATREVTAAYMAGCDGARSAVRERSGITFPGAPYEQVFFVADTVATGPMRPEEVNVYLWRDGFHLLFPMRGTDHWRIVGILPSYLRQKAGLTFEEVIPAIRQEAGAALSFSNCNWFSTYRSHHRCAERFRDRRCFLLGDAAHIHSPAGGQGMNTGLQDAYNLAWKLALVISGKAVPALLDTYEEERIPVAQRLLRTTDRAFNLLVSDRWLAGLFRTRILARVAAFAMKFKRVQTLAFRTISQTGIRYRASRLSKTLGVLPDGAPHAGDRFPWLQLKLRKNGPVEDLFKKFDDTRYNLIVIGQPAASANVPVAGDFLCTHVIPDEAYNAQQLALVQIKGPAFYLLRPDGHVGLAGINLEPSAVTHYLSEHGIFVPASQDSLSPIQAVTGS